MSTQCSRNNVAPPETRRRPCLKRGCFCQLSFWTELDYATRRKRRRKKKTHTKKAQTSLFTGAFCTADMQLELTGTFKKKKKPTTHTHKRELVGRPPCQDRNPDEGFFFFFMPISPSCCRVLLVSNSEFHFFSLFFLESRPQEVFTARCLTLTCCVGFLWAKLHAMDLCGQGCRLLFVVRAAKKKKS